VVHLKEIKMRPKIEAHDYGFKMNHARRFLENNNKVKFSLIFRGREVTHPDIGLGILKKVADDLLEIATIEAGPKKEGMAMMMVLCPKHITRKDADRQQKVMEEGDATSKEGGAVQETTQEST
jgi:translation initiation factor IF-3